MTVADYPLVLEFLSYRLTPQPFLLGLVIALLAVSIKKGVLFFIVRAFASNNDEATRNTNRMGRLTFFTLQPHELAMMPVAFSTKIVFGNVWDIPHGVSDAIASESMLIGVSMCIVLWLLYGFVLGCAGLAAASRGVYTIDAPLSSSWPLSTLSYGVAFFNWFLFCAFWYGKLL